MRTLGLNGESIYNRKKCTIPDNPFLVCPKCKKKIRKVELEKHWHSEHLILESRRGILIEKRQKCSSCEDYKNKLWQYSKSNYGIVLLCENCKRNAFNRSFGKIDVMSLAVSGGAFELGRRRH